MARLPSISRDIQVMLKENMLAIQHKMAKRPPEQRAEPYPDDILGQLEVMARINAVNLKADPQVRGKGGGAEDDDKESDPSAIVEAARRLESRAPPPVGASSEDDA